MDRRRFEQIVEEAWKQIPKRFRNRIENLAIVVEQEPSRAQLRHLPPGETLLGLYHGVPLTQRSASYGMVLPDKISLFQGPIEREARDEADIPRVVYETLWHEVAHYFGMTEEQVEASEGRRERRERPR